MSPANCIEASKRQRNNVIFFVASLNLDLEKQIIMIPEATIIEVNVASCGRVACECGRILARPVTPSRMCMSMMDVHYF
jgi:hypothetical protein